MSDTTDFLQSVVTTPEGWFCLCLRVGSRWIEEWYKWPEDMASIERRAKEAASEAEVYFSSYLFSERRSTKEHVLPSRTIQADLDEADAERLPIKPTVLVETSPGRHQAYWVLREEVDLETHELLSRRITFSIPKCDKSGWPLGRKVRIAGTLNHKYLDGSKKVEVLQYNYTTFDPQDLELLPDAPDVVINQTDEDFISSPPQELDIGPRILLETVRDKIPAKMYSGYDTQQKDRSAYLWGLMNALFRAGLGRDEVFWIAKNSPNNKFDRLRYHADRELAKNVLRAEQAATNPTDDMRTTIMQARKMQTMAVERKEYILLLVRQYMQRAGVFIRTDDEMAWYIRKDLGRPIALTPRSEKLRALLDLEFGLNETEGDTRYTLHGLCSYSSTITPNYIQSYLSFYDKQANAMLLHLGRKDVLRITASSVEKAHNGSYGVIFPWMSTSEAFTPQPGLDDWGTLLFGKSVMNVVNLSQKEAMAILKAWLLFIIFRSAAPSRPLLALIGQPGSGKTVLLKILYNVLYGRRRDLNTATKPENYDHATTTSPFVAIDQVDTWADWLPDRLAQSAGLSDVEKRKLYTDVDTVVMKRQALIGISSHDPKFWRADVADRMLLFVFERLRKEQRVPENALMESIHNARNQVWGAIISDIQKILSTPLPTMEEIPDFRIADFAQMGAWFALALGFHREFITGLERIGISQKTSTLEEDQLLVSAIQRFLDKKGGQINGEYQPVGAIWNQLQIHSSDPDAFTRTYKNAVRLHHKLWTLQDSLRQLFEVEWQHDPKRGVKVWRIACRQ